MHLQAIGLHMWIQLFEVFLMPLTQSQFKPNSFCSILVSISLFFGASCPVLETSCSPRLRTMQHIQLENMFQMVILHTHNCTILAGSLYGISFFPQSTILLFLQPACISSVIDNYHCFHLCCILLMGFHVYTSQPCGEKLQMTLLTLLLFKNLFCIFYQKVKNQTTGWGTSQLPWLF